MLLKVLSFIQEMNIRTVLTLSKRGVDCRVRSPHVLASAGERLFALQMDPATTTTETFMRKATMNARLHSIRKYLQAALMLLSDRGVFLDRTRAECKNKLYGVMIAPKSAIALAAAPFPWREGTNMPLTTSPADGLK
jgi:hypothetical protein